MKVYLLGSFRGVLVGVLLMMTVGCSQPIGQAKTPRLGTVKLATTTSTRDSGLLDVLVPMFEQQFGIKVKVIAVGSGQALELGRRGDADVLLTHSSDAEQLFIPDGFGEERHPVMHNDFVVVGPDTDPARIKGNSSSLKAFQLIANTHSPFVSRGDESGTHLKEQQLWKELHVEPAGDWYLRAGTGMAEVLRMADEKRAYTLTDRATFLTQRGKLGLVIIAEGDVLLRNQYSVIVVNSQKHPQSNHVAAQQFAAFLLSSDAQQTIGEFGVKQFEQPLFFPDAGIRQQN